MKRKSFPSNSAERRLDQVVFREGNGFQSSFNETRRGVQGSDGRVIDPWGTGSTKKTNRGSRRKERRNGCRYVRPSGTDANVDSKECLPRVVTVGHKGGRFDRVRIGGSTGLSSEKTRTPHSVNVLRKLQVPTPPTGSVSSNESRER